MKFNFYEIVKVKSSSAEKYKEIKGQEGLILGRAEENNCRVYAVSMASGETWQITEENLKSTGKVGSRDDVYSGESMQVIVDEDSGEGSLKELPKTSE